jgi:hypothetical protein
MVGIARNKHPSKTIELALQYAELKGWHYKKSGNSSHAWGRMLCPHMNRDGCKMSIWSTPSNEEAHARQIRQHIDRCPHQ